MDDELGRLSIRELIIRLADTEATIRRSACRGPAADDQEFGPPQGQLIDLARTEQRIIRELRRREQTLSPQAWTAERPLAG
ncbi:MAG TPA: hypothetical protein VK020_04605 [Microlunatus sp.]|nr:hypothetical protein [Microlunatus sp.]